MLSTQLAKISFKNMKALETRLHLIVVWFHCKLRTKNEGIALGERELQEFY